MSGIVTQPAMWRNRPAPGGGVITAVSYVQHYLDNVDRPTYTFNSCDFGAADTDRHIVVVVGHRTASARTLVSATIGGISATQDVSAVGGSGVDSLQIIRAAVPTGATGTVQVVLNGEAARMGIAIYRVIKSGALVVHHTDTNINELVSTLGINIANNGCVIGGAAYRRNSDATISGLTRDVAITLESGPVGMFAASSGLVSPAETGRVVTVTNALYVAAVGLASYS